MIYQKSEGIIINRRGVGDTDRFYTILTAEYGKIDVYARSVRSLRSRRAGSLDLFNQIRFEIVQKGSRRTLTHVELTNNYLSGKQHLGNINRLFQIGELVDALLPQEDPQLEVYQLLDQALIHLSRFDSPQYLLRFKKKLLQLLGYENLKLNDSQIDPYIESLINRSLHAKMW